jgi:hypothetical protein
MPEPPTHEAQVQFLLRIQRLLNEGAFTATYKYALLLSLADIAVESGDDSGDVLVVPISLVAEKYIAYYWRHVAPYVPQFSDPSVILRQNTDRQAAIVTAVADARLLHANRPAFRRPIGRVKGYFWEQPLWLDSGAGSAARKRPRLPSCQGNHRSRILSLALLGHSPKEPQYVAT